MKLMKAIGIVALLVPCMSYGQKYNFQGEYKLADEEGRRLKVWDTIRQSFTFKDDSVKISFAVMRPNGKVAVSVDYDEYFTWKITRQERADEKDTTTGINIIHEQMDVTLSDGRLIGYFEYTSSLDVELRKTLPNGITFVRNGKRFIKAGPPRQPLMR